MPDTLIKMKTGTMSKLEQGPSAVPMDPGSVYFAVDTTTHKGRIVYDVDKDNRIVMSTDAERADQATHATAADEATVLAEAKAIDGVNFDGSANIIHYGTCATTASTKIKIVPCANFVLNTGSRIIIKFSNSNTASEPQLNVGQTGAKPIYYKGNPIPVDVYDEKSLVANGTYEFVYDASVANGVWQYVGTIAANIGITVDDDSKTMFITSPIVNGDGVSY